MPVRISKNRVALENIPLNLAAELDLASATTTNIGAALSNNILITGTTTITAFDNVTPGIIRFLRFDSALTLTHNGTSLILPGSANITTAASDSALAVSLGSGNWKVHFYQKASGVAVSSPPAPTIQVFTSSGTWTKPAGCKVARVRIIGAGGGAGGWNSYNGYYGGGGGGGGFAEELIDVTGTSSETVTVGAGGIGGTSNGNSGGSSSFGAYVSATGGVYGSGSNGTTGAGGAGGTGSGGNLHITGTSGTNGTTVAGIGGESFYRKNYGGGGNGATGGGVAGDTGTNGIVLVEEFY